MYVISLKSASRVPSTSLGPRHSQHAEPNKKRSGLWDKITVVRLWNAHTNLSLTLHKGVGTFKFALKVKIGSRDFGVGLKRLNLDSVHVVYLGEFDVELDEPHGPFRIEDAI